jgi:hypothetical protein
MLDGECLELTTPAPLTSEIESGLWPTPTRRDYRSESCSQEYADKRNGESRGKTLPWTVRWATPTVKGNYNRKGLSPKSGDGLATQVKKWPTPHGFSKDGRSNGPSGNELGRAVNRSFPTPVSTSATGGRKGLDGGAHARQRLVDDHGEEAARELTGGSLNPPWVEWLMGWVIGWTDLRPLEMGKYRQWLRSHGAR